MAAHRGMVVHVILLRWMLLHVMILVAPLQALPVAPFRVAKPAVVCPTLATGSTRHPHHAAQK